MSASAPAPSQGDNNNNGSSGQRAMRLKVLYAFDAEGKQTCVARWHQFVYTQVYYMNPETPIGVVDLKTCLNSIASASPEIVSLLEKDYSVYSYDYSEEGTPLQGLGLLSWIMGSGATASSGGVSQQQQNPRLITGRVVSAQIGLFKSEKDTLEVKMKLVPVSAMKQSDYINSMNVYNTLSQIIPGNFDASSWSAYFQANTELLQAAATVNAGAGARPGGNSGYREPAVQVPVQQQQYAAPVPAPVQHQAQQYQHQHQQQQQQQHQQPQQQQQPQQHQQLHHQAPQHTLQHPPTLQGPPQQVIPQQQPAQQGATQTVPPQANPQQNVAQSPVTQPVTTQPAVEEIEPPKKKPRKRNPKPPAATSTGGRKKPVPSSQSIPSAASTPAASQSDAYVPASHIPPSESTFASPDLPRAVPVRQSYAHSPLADVPSVETFAANTPHMEVPASSPPTDDLQHVVEESPQQQAYSPEPLSPILPGLHDSPQQEIADGLDLTKELDILFQVRQQQQEIPQVQAEEQAQAQDEGKQQEQTQEQEELDVDTPSQTLPPPPPPPPTSQPQVEMETPGASQSQVEQAGAGAEQAPEAYSAVLLKFAHPADDSFITAAPSPINELPLPANTLVQDKPAKRKRKYVRKKGIMSDAVAPSDIGDEEERMVKGQGQGEELSQEAEALNKLKKAKPTTGGRTDAEKKQGDDAEKSNRSQGPTSAKERIEAQLREAVKEGKMPNYCGNCGAIETPTWRRVSLKDEGGDPEKDQNILLCNPCGLWHATKKSMRPPELWDPKKDDGPPKRPRNNRKRKATGAPLHDVSQDSENHAQPIQQMMAMSEPIVIEDVDDGPVAHGHQNRATTPDAGHSTTVQGWVDAVRASQRRIQSSPAKREGTMDSPIELDMSPCPARRCLFPRTPTKGTLDLGEEKGMDMDMGMGNGIFDDVPPAAGKENVTPPHSASKTPKRRRLATPEKTTATTSTSRSTVRRSPYFTLTTPQKQFHGSAATTTTLELSPTSDLLNRFLSEGNDPISTDYPSWFNVVGDSEDVFATDDLMPSSPPAFFGLYEDAGEAEGGGVWSEFLPEEEGGMDGEGGEGGGGGGYGLDGILGALENNILEGGKGGALGAGEVQIVGSGGLVDFSGFFEEEEGGVGLGGSGSGSAKGR